MQLTTPLISSKLFNFSDACSLRENLSQANKRVVLTNGCFDLLHPGHVFSLKQAKQLGDFLWVALNSDKSIKYLKGDSRPIFDENARAYMLSALEMVDGIFIFEGPRLAEELVKFHPDVYVKSGDYSPAKLDPDEKKALGMTGADIQFVPYLSGFGTTDTILQLGVRLGDKHTNRDPKNGIM